MADHYTLPHDITWTEVATGNRRAVLSHRPEMMLVAFSFEPGATGASHSSAMLLGSTFSLSIASLYPLRRVEAMETQIKIPPSDAAAPVAILRHHPRDCCAISRCANLGQ